MHFAQRVRALVVLNGVALLPLFAPWSGIPRPLYALFAGRKGMPAIARYYIQKKRFRPRWQAAWLTHP
ncbi:hypothetical protein ACUOFC_28135 [Escherichia sp. TWPC-MK]